MARSPARVLRPSVLDRLCGATARPDAGAVDAGGVRALKEAVARDLRWLLNTRAFLDRDLESRPEVQRSLLTYGLPDLSVFSWTNPADGRRIAARIEQAVRDFEPRLVPRSVKVSIAPRRGLDDFSLRFRIDAVLHVEPVREPVAYDTQVDFDSGGIAIEEAP